MSSLKTNITEITTALGMLGYRSAADALSTLSSPVANVSVEVWQSLIDAYQSAEYNSDFETAFENGRRFLSAKRGLRNRPPIQVEWKGIHRNRGDESLPIDLRIDYVYLISCKYLSKILHNASPSRLFEGMLVKTTSIRSTDWFYKTAADQFEELYKVSVQACQLADHSMPGSVAHLKADHRKLIKYHQPKTWPDDVQSAYRNLCEQVSTVTAAIWNQALGNKLSRVAFLWRMLRFGAAPYYILGSAPKISHHLMVVTPWDWDHHYQLLEFEIVPAPAGQPTVNWHAHILDKQAAQTTEIKGHVEIRWSHGRFSGPPEAKVYLDSDFASVPGYWPIE